MFRPWLVALLSLFALGCGDDRVVVRDDDRPAVVNVDDLEPLAEDLLLNGGVMAASGGWTYAWEFSGSNSTPDAIHRIGADGTVERDWIVDVHGRPHLSRSGHLWTVGTRYLVPSSLGREQRIDAFDLATGDFVETVFLDDTGEPSMFMTDVVEGEEGILFGTTSTETGIRRVTSATESEKLLDGFGGNTHLAMASDGTLFIGTGRVFGRWADEFEILLSGPVIRSIVILPDDSIVVVTEAYGKWFSSDGSESKIVVETNLGRGFKSGAWDAVTGGLVVLTLDGKLYRIPFGD